MLSIFAALRMTTRAFRRVPGFFLVAIFTLAVGIGANVALFTVVNAVLLRPLPYPQSEQVMAVWQSAPGLGMPQAELSDATYVFYRQQNRSLQDLGIYTQAPVSLTGGEEPERIEAAQATGSVFSVLRVPPALGRTIQEADEKPGAEQVVVLSHELWKRRFSGTPEVLGAQILVDGVSHRVVGVMPPGFRFPMPEVGLWRNLILDPATMSAGNLNFRGVGRLRPGQSSEQAARDLTSLVERLPDVPGMNVSRSMLETARLSVLVHPLRDEIVGGIERTLWLLLGSVGLILLIACANVANLFLVRAEGRQREVAVYLALGASSGEITRLFLIEGLALALSGGALGLALAATGVRLLVSLRPEGLPRLDEIGVDGTVLAFTVAAALFSGLLVGVIAALRYSRPNLAPALREGGRGGTVGRERLRARSVLVVVQVALALVLLIGAGLMAKSFWRLRTMDLGLDPGGILTVRLSLPEKEYQDNRATARFVSQLLEQVRSIPGVTSAGSITVLPLTGDRDRSAHMIEGVPVPPDSIPPILGTRFASPGYFETLRIPVIEGRGFDRLDPSQEGAEVVVSRSLVERFWPGQSGVGKRLFQGMPTDPQAWFTVIGVVKDVHDSGVNLPVQPLVYYPVLRRGPARSWVPRDFTLVIRGSADPLALSGQVRRAVREIDPELPLAQVMLMEQVVARSMVRTTFTMLLLLIAAGIALLLGAVGIYGMISYVVSQRTREIGVRMALGATRQEIARLFLKEGLTLALTGILIGLATAVAVTRLMETLLYEVSPTDTPTFTGVATLLAAVALLASYLPARRAAGVQPLEAIRYE